MKKKLRDCTLSDLLRTCMANFNEKKGCGSCPFRGSSFCMALLIPVTTDDWEKVFDIREDA